MKEWRYIKPLSSEDIISETEKQLGIKFDESYVEFVKKYNGGRPPISVFDTNITKERTIKSFLSLNPSDSENMIDLNSTMSNISEDLVAVAIDNFGNYICVNKKNGSIVFLDYETGTIEFISDNFSNFIDILNRTNE